MAGIVYYFFVLNNQQKNQKLTATYDVLEAFRNEKYYYNYLEVLRLEWETIDEFWDKYNTPEWQSKWGTMFQHYDGLGLLWKKRLLDLDDFSHLMGQGCLDLWVRYKPVVEDMRLKHAPDYLCYWEILCEALEPILKDKWDKAGRGTNNSNNQHR